jgi:hypothetical protein
MLMDLGTHVARQLEEARSISVEGVLIDSPTEGALILVPCLCVQDSPDNPCPCNDWLKWIIGRKDILGEPEKTERKNSSGESVFRVRVASDAKVIVEKGQAMPAELAAAMTTSQTARAAMLPPRSPFPWPVGTPPTFPVPDDVDPLVVYAWAQILSKWGPAVIGAVGGVIGGWLGSSDEDCTTNTTTTETVNPDGSKTTRTVTETVCT